MKAKFLIAETATVHPDGTFSLLRGGINTVASVKAPYVLQGSLIAMVNPDIGDKGPHSFDISLQDTDGKDVMEKLEGTFSVPDCGGGSTFVLRFHANFAHAGEHVFVLRIDNVIKDQWFVNVIQQEELDD